MALKATTLPSIHQIHREKNPPLHDDDNKNHIAVITFIVLIVFVMHY